MGKNRRIWSAVLVFVGAAVGIAATSLPAGEPEYVAVIVNGASSGSQRGDYSESETVTNTLNSLAEQGLTLFNMTALNEDRVLIVARSRR
jgi:hypothetical protein